MRIITLFCTTLLTLLSLDLNASGLQGVKSDEEVPFITAITRKYHFFEKLNKESVENIVFNGEKTGYGPESYSILAHNFIITKVFNGSKDAYFRWFKDEFSTKIENLKNAGMPGQLNFHLNCNIYQETDYRDLDLPYVKDLWAMTYPNDYQLLENCTHRFCVISINP